MPPPSPPGDAVNYGMGNWDRGTTALEFLNMPTSIEEYDEH